MSPHKIFKVNISPERFLLLKQNPLSKALISNQIIYSYDDLKQKVLKSSWILIEDGINAGERIGILCTNNVEFVILVLALWQISAVPVPINSRLTSKEILDLLNDLNCKTVFAQQELRNKISSGQIKIIEFPLNRESNSKFEERKEIQLKDPAVIICTSGSENKSKAVVLFFESLFNSAINSNQLLRYSNSDRWLASLPFYHVGGFSIIVRSLLFGIPLIIPDSLSAEDLSKALISFQPTFISLVAAQLKHILEKNIKPNIDLKNCLLGGGFSENELIKNAIDLGWPVNKVYGSTETSSFVTALLSDEFTFKPNSVGRPVPSNTISIVDDSKNELKQFEIGEVAVRSNALMSGYFKDDETKKVIQNGLYFTGDLGYLDEDGYLFIVGRKNYLISTGGENVNPAEVEQVLLQHPVISEAAVFPIEDEKWGEIVVAAIVLKKDSSEISYSDIKSFLEKKMAGFKIPKKIFFEKSLPKSELDKVEKDKLIKRYTL